MPTEEWAAHGGFDDIDEVCLDYDGTGMGEDDPDDYLSESDE